MRCRSCFDTLDNGRDLYTFDRLHTVSCFQCFFYFNIRQRYCVVVGSGWSNALTLADLSTSPFLSSVTDAASFDSSLETYISGAFIDLRFQQLIGCSAFNGSVPDAYYARYTTSVLCNSIIQNSIQDCGLQGNAALPLCADSCVCGKARK